MVLAAAGRDREDHVVAPVTPHHDDRDSGTGGGMAMAQDPDDGQGDGQAARGGGRRDRGPHDDQVGHWPAPQR